MPPTLPKDNISPNENRSDFSGKKSSNQSQDFSRSMADAESARAEQMAKQKSRLNPLSHRQLLAKDIPPRKSILHPWLPEAGIAMVFAPPGVGKTYLCLSVAILIASGGELFGWAVSEPRKVLYLDGEMHESDLRARVAGLKLNLDSEPDERLLFLNGQWTPDFVMPDLSTSQGQEEIEALIDQHGVQILFIDNLSTLCLSGRENETDSWKPVQTWLVRLRRKGVSTVLVHHAGKSKANGMPVQRGTSMREVVLDSCLVLDHPSDYSEEMGCVFELKYNKARGFWGADATQLRVELNQKEGRWHFQPLAKKNYDRAVEMYNDGVTNPKEIASELGISRQAVQKHLNHAKRDGDISC